MFPRYVNFQKCKGREYIDKLLSFKLKVLVVQFSSRLMLYDVFFPLGITWWYVGLSLVAMPSKMEKYRDIPDHVNGDLVID